MLRLRNPFPLELCKKTTKKIIHTYRGKKVKCSKLAQCQHYKKGQKKDKKSSPFSLGANFCLYPFSKEKLPFALQKNSMYAQWGKAATQGSNGKNCALQIIFESWISCTMLVLGCSSRGEGPDPAPGQEDSTVEWVRGGRGLLSWCLLVKQEILFTSLFTTMWQSEETTVGGKEDTRVVQMRGASMVVSPSASQVSMCLGHFNCKVPRWWAVSPCGPGTIEACFC